MSLRSRKYGDEWRPVWDFLGDEHRVPGPLDVDQAVEQLTSELAATRTLVPGSVAPMVFELIADAHQIGLRQDHVARLAGLVSDDEAHRLQLLEHASAHLNWETSDLHEWEEVLGAVPMEGNGPPESQLTPPTEPEPEGTEGPSNDGGPVTTAREGDDPAETSRFPEVKRAAGMAPTSLHDWTKQLSADHLTSMPPLPDTPSCSSTGASGGLDGKATTVYGRFDIEAGVEDLRYATDPMNWPKCSWFFISMTEQAASVPLKPPDDVGSTAYLCALEELVGLDDLLTVRTGLTTRYFVGSDSVGMEFDLTPGTHGDGKVDVDHGFLLAERHPTEQGKLVVTSQKTFSFVGLDDLPFSFLCEFGWIDMMRAMAQCRAPGG
ncbi:MAG: hypothetical protein WAL25_13820 [Acidimicrobiia bacterium]